MVQGLYAAAAGMISLEDRQSVIANNIANAATSGFKRQHTVDEGFHQVFLGALGSPRFYDLERGPGGGVRTLATATDFAAGPITHTGNPLNLGLIGPGFFVVDTPQGERYTRNGGFTVDADGQLATPDGYKVLGDGGGGIDVNGGVVLIDEHGFVSVDGANAGRLRIVEFADPRVLYHAGNSLFSLAEDAPAGVEAAETTVVPESLEGSNVRLPVEMAQMMLGMRAYNANQKVIASADETLSRLINEVGSPL